MTWLYDSHIHLTDSYYQNDLDYIIRGMENMKIQACCVSMDTMTSQKTLDLGSKGKLLLLFIWIYVDCINDDF